MQTATDINRGLQRDDFPLLGRVVHGKPLAYLDSAATTQKPNAVIEAIDAFYRETNANVHRGLHRLAQEATDLYEGARADVREHLNANDTREIVFVRGTTEAINLVAQSYLRPRATSGDEVIVTEMEHHANIVPWQIVGDMIGVRLRVVPIDNDGQIDLEAFERLLNPRTRLVAVTHVSNVLGTINPVKTIIKMTRQTGAAVLVDGAQAVPHMPVDLQDLDCDFYTLSGHKTFGPTGIGVLFGKAELLNAMPPYQGGGDMIQSVTWEGTTFKDAPARFEAGTPHIAGAVGLAAALGYLRSVGYEHIAKQEQSLLAYATARLQALPGLRLIGTADHKAAVLSFVLDGVHPHDVATVLDAHGVATRAGHHCAQPLMRRFGVPATTRASLAFYNSQSDLDALITGIESAREMFQ